MAITGTSSTPTVGVSLATLEARARASLVSAGIHSYTSAPAKGTIGPGIYLTRRVGTHITVRRVTSLAPAHKRKRPATHHTVVTRRVATATTHAAAPSAGHSTPVKRPSHLGTSSGSAGVLPRPALPTGGSSLLDSLTGSAEFIVIGVALFVLALIILRKRRR